MRNDETKTYFGSGTQILSTLQPNYCGTFAIQNIAQGTQLNNRIGRRILITSVYAHIGITAYDAQSTSGTTYKALTNGLLQAANSVCNQYARLVFYINKGANTIQSSNAIPSSGQNINGLSSIAAPIDYRLGGWKKLRDDVIQLPTVSCVVPDAPNNTPAVQAGKDGSGSYPIITLVKKFKKGLLIDYASDSTTGNIGISYGFPEF